MALRVWRLLVLSLVKRQQVLIHLHFQRAVLLAAQKFCRVFKGKCIIFTF